MKNVLLSTLIVGAGLLAWIIWINAAARRTPLLVEPNSADGLAEKAISSPNETPSNLPLAGKLTSLSQSEIADGFQLIRDAERQVTMIVHPQSPCWLELPDASPPVSGTSTASDKQFVGPDACRDCHREQYAGFVNTAHARTSSSATPSSILGSTEPGENDFTTVHPDLSFKVVEQDGRVYQEVHFRSLTRRIPIDIVTGSGKTAQTYLFWQGDRLFQSHLTYFKPVDAWVNSPGYHDGTAWYTRTTIPKCVQCHTTFAAWKSGTENRYSPDSLIFGVSCERCHGPGREHVDFHRSHPEERQAKFIANPSALSPERTNDVCAQCHLGTATPLQEPFSFRPGDTLADHFEVVEEEEGKGQVHTSNQLQRMQLSECFLQSDGLTCAACHNPHQNEHGNTRLFSQRCIECHPAEHCGMAETVGPSIRENCIDCHMGMGYDDHIQLEKASEVHMPLLRDHYIRILPDATERFLKESSR